ncbi:potassium channel family protein [Skermanella sp. TT6]|uniref:Potassium channel family protein n=1 Tax=Skermanella cutis TaxID=2775420 RepID=A0ABX7B9D0_9PROT|nr:potassium channel family protein [Skermanella sp. TT6]QQP89072.1 potassium channel family protein [Skermanella sp. TT6]
MAGGKTRRRARRRKPGGLILHVNSGLSPEKKLLVRGGIILALVATVIAVFWFDREGLKDNLDDHISFSDILYFTAVTITTVGYGDIVPVTDTARLIDAFAVTPIRIFIWFIFLGTAYEFVVQKIVEDFRMSRIQQNLRDHVVLCGFGHSAMIAAREMIAKGHPDDAVVAIDVSEERVRAAADAGFIGLLGDATSEELLTLACVEKAKAVLVNTRRDDTNILVILTVRHLSSSTRIVASIRDEENIKLARLSGADLVVTPTRIGGYLLADAVASQHATPFLCDLMSAGGHMVMTERPAGPEDIGRTMAHVSSGVVVHVHSNGREIPFIDRERYVIREGDRLLMICPSSRHKPEPG